MKIYLRISATKMIRNLFTKNLMKILNRTKIEILSMMIKN